MSLQLRYDLYSDPRVAPVGLVPDVLPPKWVCATCAAVVIDVPAHYMSLHPERA